MADDEAQQSSTPRDGLRYQEATLYTQGQGYEHDTHVSGTRPRPQPLPAAYTPIASVPVDYSPYTPPVTQNDFLLSQHEHWLGVQSLNRHTESTPWRNAVSGRQGSQRASDQLSVGNDLLVDVDQELGDMMIPGLIPGTRQKRTIHEATQDQSHLISPSQVKRTKLITHHNPITNASSNPSHVTTSSSDLSLVPNTSESFLGPVCNIFETGILGNAEKNGCVNHEVQVESVPSTVVTSEPDDVHKALNNSSVGFEDTVSEATEQTSIHAQLLAQSLSINSSETLLLQELPQYINNQQRDVEQVRRMRAMPAEQFSDFLVSGWPDIDQYYRGIGRAFTPPPPPPQELTVEESEAERELLSNVNDFVEGLDLERVEWGISVWDPFMQEEKED